MSNRGDTKPFHRRLGNHFLFFRALFFVYHCYITTCKSLLRTKYTLFPFIWPYFVTTKKEKNDWPLEQLVKKIAFLAIFQRHIIYVHCIRYIGFVKKTRRLFPVLFSSFFIPKNLVVHHIHFSKPPAIRYISTSLFIISRLGCWKRFYRHFEIFFSGCWYSIHFEGCSWLCIS